VRVSSQSFVVVVLSLRSLVPRQLPSPVFIRHSSLRSARQPHLEATGMSWPASFAIFSCAKASTSKPLSLR